MGLNTDYWHRRYKDNQTGWDIGHPSPPIIDYANQLQNKHLKILIPGCGNAYEAEYLFKAGFSNVYVLDFVQSTLDLFKERVPDFPEYQLICKDFFEYHNTFDLILEQTFFCALHPKKRLDYVSHIKKLLVPNGKLTGVLFDQLFEKEGPPFGGTKEGYDTFFSPHFNIKTLERCYNSIPPRQGNELFFIFENSY